MDLVLRGGRVVDGTGAPPYAADVVLHGGRIADLLPPPSERSTPTLAGAPELDVTDLLITPGFIDIHSHSDMTLVADPRAVSSVTQGVTMEVVGNCGHGCAPITDVARFAGNIYGYRPEYDIDWHSMGEYLERLERGRTGVHVASLVPNGNLRLAAAADLGRSSSTEESVHYSAAWAELGQFSEQLGIPVGETFAGRGAMREDSPMVIGGHGVTGGAVAARLAAEADLIISVGTRLTDFTTSSQSMFQHPEVKFININVSAKDAYKQGAVPVTADARNSLVALTRAAAEAGLAPDPEYAADIARQKDDWGCILEREVLDPIPGEIMNQGQLISVMNEEAKRGDPIVAAADGPPGDLHKMWDATGERHCHLEFGFSCMGYEIPAGIGVRMNQSDGEVVVYIGDGTYLMNPMELVTAVQEGQKITIVVANNHGYQVIRQLQMGRAGRSFGNEFRSRDVEANKLEGDYLEIDYAANAGSMGARTWRVSNPDEVRRALREARSAQGPCVIVAEVEKHRYLPGAGTWWDIAAAEATDDELTQQLRDEYVEGRSQQRFYY